MHKSTSILLLGVLMSGLAGCAASASSQSFPRATARAEFAVEYGEVIDARMVRIEGQATVVGRLGGAWFGRALALGNSGYAGGDWRIQGAAGALAGTVAGEAIERAARSADGLQITVRLENDDIVAVVQEADVMFLPGDPVRLLSGEDGSRRVQHL